MKRYLILVLFLPLILNACATPVRLDTPSGKPEVTVNNTDIKKVRDTVTNSMITAGYRLVKTDDSTATFDRVISDGGMANFLYGSQYDMNPAERIQYTFLEQNKSVRVVADMSIITNPGSAFERRHDFNNHAESKIFQQKLNELKIFLEGQKR